MKIAVIAPIREHRDDYERLEAEITRFFREEIYEPLLKELGAPVKAIRNAYDFEKNARDLAALKSAIDSGRVRFYRGRFSGKFSSKLSRALKALGARWDGKQGSFSLPSSQLPPEIKHAIAASESAFKKAAERVTERLAAVTPEALLEKLDLTRIFDTSIYRIDKDIQKSLEGITISPTLTPEARARIAEEYTRNLNIPIKDFIQKETLELRKRIIERSYAGYRYEGMVKEIQQSYGVSQRKAKFLARQETSLLMTKFKQVRYQAAGSNEYIWGCVKMPHQHRGAKYKPGDVRYYHGLNEGKTFKWSEGAVVNANGEKKNPGQDYGCRCFARPIVRFD